MSLPAFLSRAARPAGAIGLLLSSLSPLPASDYPVTSEELSRGYRTRSLIAKPRPGATQVTAAESRAKVRLVRAHPRLGGIRILSPERAEEEAAAAIARLQATGLYEYVEPDYIRRLHVVPDDTRFASDQWSLHNTGQSGGTAGADIRAAAAWEIQREAPDVIVAVMDTGIHVGHPDLIGNLWRNSTEWAARPALDDDGNGYIDDVHGINATVARTGFLAGDPSDQSGHGTHVAGIIGAVGNNALGVTGVAWKVQIMGLKFIGSRVGSASAAVACIDYAIAQKAHLINGSYGSTTFSRAEFDAIARARDAGIIFVASAGNDSQEITAYPEYPAAYALDNIVAVASSTRQDKLASYSTYGSGLVELAAPGSSILSLGLSAASPYVTLNGTSMAAPHVTGALALLKQKYPTEHYRSLINRLLSSVDPLPALDHRVHTNGRLNLERALTTTDARPFNDDFARRAVITGAFNTVRGSNRGATREPGEPDHGAAGGTGSLWWEWTAPADTGQITLATAGSAIDTVLAVYALPAGGAPASAAGLTPVAANDNAAAGTTTSSVSFAGTGGATYVIAVAGQPGPEGFVTFNLTSVPRHDAFAAAWPLTGPSAAVTVTNTGATAEPGEPKPRSSRGTALGIDRSLWFKWTAPATHTYQFSAYGETTDPLLAVYTGSSLETLSLVAYDDDTGPGLDSLVRFTATAGVTYLLKLDSATSPAGRVTVSIADAAWQYVADFSGWASPALAADGTIYLPDSYGYIHAVSPAGVRRWRSSAVAGFIFGGSLAVGADGTLYAADAFGVVYALDPAAGAKKWEFDTGGFIWAAPAIAADGTVLVKVDHQLFALKADGTLRWKTPVPGDTSSSPVVAADGTIYVAASGETALYALDPEGALRWRTDLGATVYATPALGADGTIYLGNYDGRFFAIRPDGTVRWHFDTGSPLSASAAVDARGVVYFGSYDHKLYALDGATGVKKWDYATGDVIRATGPVLGDDNTIYIGSDDAFIHAVDASGRLRRTYATAGLIYSHPLLAAGRLYVSSSDSKLYAFETDTNLARSPWPMAGHNPRRLARATELDGIPAFTAQPVAPTDVSAGNATSLQALATVAGGGSVSYQWYFNDAALPGATQATLAIASAQGSNSGVYRVLATGSGGSTISLATTLRVAAAATDRSRLVNLAIRTQAGGGDAVLFLGFAIGGSGTSGPKPLLLRGVGPTLAAFGVTGALADPRLQIYSGSTLLLENDDWGQAANAAQIAALSPQVGAFALAGAASKDAALFTSRNAGSYTAQLSGPGADTGTVLAEIYDATLADAFTAATPRLTNISARTRVGTGGDPLFAGFVITGTTSKRVLIRAVGPTLATFGVDAVLADPRLELFRSGTVAAISTNDNWGQAANAVEIATAAASVGAFGLPLESRDAVLLVTLPAGSYTAQISGPGTSTGVALVEVYEVP